MSTLAPVNNLWLGCLRFDRTQKSAFIPLILTEVLWLLVSFREMTRNKAKQMHIYILRMCISVNVDQSSKATDPYLRSCWVLAPAFHSDCPWVRTGLLSCLCTSDTGERRCLASPCSSWGSDKTCTPAATGNTTKVEWGQRAQWPQDIRNYSLC